MNDEFVLPQNLANKGQQADEVTQIPIRSSYVKGSFEWFPKHSKKSDYELQCFRREEKIWFGKGCKKQRREVRNTHRLLASKKVKLQKRNTKGRFLNSYGVGTHTS